MSAGDLDGYNMHVDDGGAKVKDRSDHTMTWLLQASDDDGGGQKAKKAKKRK